MTNRYLLDLSYLGTHYDGWQIQKNTANTIQRVVNEKLTTLLGEEIMVTASGRTDAGVHAKQNYAHLDVSKKLPGNFLRRLNFLLPRDIAANALYIVDDDFNARFDAISRTYEYFISYDKNPFLSEISCYYPYPHLSIKKLNEVAKYLQSQSDFAAFSKKRTQVKTTLCKISEAYWEAAKPNEIIRFTISADRFLRGMVRGIIGTSIRFARDKMTMDELKQLLASKKAHRTDFSAPAQGLTLLRVLYPKGYLRQIEEKR